MKSYFKIILTLLCSIAVFSFSVTAQNTTKLVFPSNTKNDTTMKIGIIIETKEYEKAWNAFRFAIVAKEQGHEVKIFLMGEGVECVELTHEKYNVKEKYDDFVSMGGIVYACGTCLRSRNMQGTETCPLSNMMTCVDMVVWADKVVTF